MQIEIQGVNLQGNGYGFLNKKKIFIPKTCKGDIVEYKIIKENKDFIIGQLIKILKFSDNRNKNTICCFYENCGGCSLLHLKEDDYYDFKINIIKNSVKNLNFDFDKINLIKIGSQKRRRVTFQVKNNKLGFFEKNSNNLVEINRCFLVKDEINNLVPLLNNLIKKISIKEIFITSHENGLEIIFDIEKSLNLYENKLLKEFSESFDDIIIVSYKIDNGEPFLFLQKKTPTMTFQNNIKIELKPNIFLQATEEGQEAITKMVVESLEKCKKILDLYCGIGTYTFPLVNFANLHSVEGNQDMVDIINKNVNFNKLNGKITTECRNLVSSFLLKDELNTYDGIVINPPRNGAKAQCQEIAKSNVKKVVMVSCSPQTFSKDAKELYKNNYKLINLAGIDQFYKTQHLEIVGVFEKK